MRRLALALWLALAAPVWAQGTPPPATLVADAIEFDGERLTASGSVEIFADGRVLRARRITYLRAEDRLVVEGPITLVDGPDRVVIADFADLTPDLRGAVLRGARLVLDRRLQIAAAEIARDRDGRYTQLYQTVASACTVCAENPTPLWQIRARRIVQDEQENQIYFENARFEVAGVPIAWFPRLRLPGPGLERSSGWLAPRFSSDELLGFGVTTPYFFTLGPSRDLTLSPYLTNRGTRSLGLRYRQAFDAGSLSVEGAVARDDIRPDDLRGYLFADGSFALPRDYRLDFDVEAVTDDTFLLNYDISERDRLDSRVAVSRVERDNRVLAEAVVFQSLREEEDDRFLPSRVVTVTREGRSSSRRFGGQINWLLEGHARERPATSVPAGRPGDSARDVLRASAAIDWRRDWIGRSGLKLTAIAGLHVDGYNVRQDRTDFADTTFTRFVPYAGVEARYPLVRRGDGGVTHTLEPVAQLILAPATRSRTPNEDSLTPEFDEGNLFAVSRFPGRDNRELGNRVNLGVGYTRRDPSGWSVGVQAGRVFRVENLEQFRPGTGLDGRESDWLLSLQAFRGDRFGVMHRAVFDDGLTFARAETILRWTGPRHALETRHTWLQADEGAGRPRDTSDWAVDLTLDVGRDWTARANWRYDFVTDDASRAGLGLTYRSDCVTVDLGVERRFTSTDDLEPATRFGLSVELAGFGADDRPTDEKRRRCGL